MFAYIVDQVNSCQFQRQKNFLKSKNNPYNLHVYGCIKRKEKKNNKSCRRTV